MEEEDAQSTIGQLLGLRLIVAMQMVFDPNREAIMDFLHRLEASSQEDNLRSKAGLRSVLGHIEEIIEAIDDPR